ncbi:hypothetical protein C8R46DRAFT_1097052, partial [Mycena filopes]
MPLPVPHPSTVQPWLVAILKEFRLPLRDVPPDYPYTIEGPTTGLSRIPYFEFHGLGPPLDLDVGMGGDIYVDLTPGAFALWGKTARGWKRWLDMGVYHTRALDSGSSVRHPFFAYSLWISTRGVHSLSWYKMTGGGRTVDATRSDFINEGLFTMPKVGLPKAESTACREASAMLAHIADPGVPEFPAWALSAALKRAAAVVVPTPPTRTPAMGGVRVEQKSPVWSRPAVVLPEHPCVLNPRPTSLMRPKISVKLKGFVLRTLPTSYPFRLQHTDDGAYHVPYHQFSDVGPPTLDVGTAGDIYLDLTPGAYGLYGRTDFGWKRWRDTGERLQSEWPVGGWLVRHPHLESYVLWVRFPKDGEASAGNVCWYGSTSSAKAARAAAKKLGVVNAESAILERALGPSSASSVPTLARTISLKREASPLLGEPTKKVKQEEPEEDLAARTICLKREASPLLGEPTKKVKQEEPEEVKQEAGGVGGGTG